MIIYIINILLVLLGNNLNETNVATKITSSCLERKLEKEVHYQTLYDSTISFIKYHEGFRANWYDDGGYACIGYGQRRAFYKGIISAPVTESQADSILRISFDNHLELVKKVFPKLNRKQRLSVGHMSFCIGIGKIKKYELVTNNKINVTKLMSLPHKGNRQFEVNMFYN